MQKKLKGSVFIIEKYQKTAEGICKQPAFYECNRHTKQYERIVQ